MKAIDFVPSSCCALGHRCLQIAVPAISIGVAARGPIKSLERMLMSPHSDRQFQIKDRSQIQIQIRLQVQVSVRLQA